jgi:Zn-dependent M28 family amino/carboxypeptidase
VRALGTRRLLASTLGLLLLASCSGGGGGGRAASPTTTTARPTPASLVADVEEARLRATLTALVGTRVTAAERAKARALITKELESAGVAVVEEPFGEDGVNLIGRIPGRKPATEVLLLSAHYDTVVGAPGADDDGSGVVAVLEAARVLASARLDSPIEVALFDLEEPGLLGSQHHLTVGRPVDAGFNLDMVGYTCHTKGCQVVFPDIANCLDAEDASDVGEGIAAVADAQGGRVLDAFLAARDAHVPGLHVGTGRLTGNGECLEDARRSDHAPFWDADREVVFLTDTANFRNPNYHRPSDDLGTIDFGLLTDVTRVMVGAMAALGGAAAG